MTESPASQSFLVSVQCPARIALRGVEVWSVERSEAEAIYDQGREVVVAVLLRMDEQIARLSERVAKQDERIAQLERRLGRNSRNFSLGSQSEQGERRIERLLSAHTTCRLQRRSLHAYLIDLLSTHARGDPAPLLT